MPRPFTATLRSLRLLPRAILLVAALAAQVVAMPLAGGDHGSRIEAPGQKKSNGAGFVLLVSLQRG